MTPLDPVVLDGGDVRLVPLGREHCAELLNVAAHDDVFAHLPMRAPRTEQDMDAYIATALAAWRRGERLPFAMESDGRAVGTTSLWFPNPARSQIEIGSTWLSRELWGTGVNRQAKLLLLEYAFTVLGFRQVIFRTDVDNLRSQRAIEKLGAVRDRIVVADLPLTDGTWRDSVYYSITSPTGEGGASSQRH